MASVDALRRCCDADGRAVMLRGSGRSSYCDGHWDAATATGQRRSEVMLLRPHDDAVREWTELLLRRPSGCCDGDRTATRRGDAATAAVVLHCSICGSHPCYEDAGHGDAAMGKTGANRACAMGRKKRKTTACCVDFIQWLETFISYG